MRGPTLVDMVTSVFSTTVETVLLHCVNNPILQGDMQ